MTINVDGDEYVTCPRCNIFKSDPKTILEHLLRCKEEIELGHKMMRLSAAYLMEHPEAVRTNHDLAAPKKDEKLKGPMTNYEAAKLRQERKKKRTATCVVSQKTDETSLTGDPEIDGAMAEIKLAETVKAQRRVRDRNFNKDEVDKKNVDGENVGESVIDKKLMVQKDTGVEVVVDAQEGGNVGKVTAVDGKKVQGGVETGFSSKVLRKFDASGHSVKVVADGKFVKQTAVDGKNVNNYSHRGIVIPGQQGATLRDTSKIIVDSKGKQKFVDDLSLRKREQRDFQAAIANSKNQKRFFFGEGSSTGIVGGGVLREVRDGKPKANVEERSVGHNVGKRTAWDSKNVPGGGVEAQYSSKDLRKPKEAGVKVVADGQEENRGEKLQKEANGANVEKEEKVDFSKEIGRRISEYWRDAGEEDLELNKIWLSFKISDQILKIWREAAGGIS